ncbi:MAG: ABC transporter permease [Cyclobacteriaceae bacterium]|nr:ABC transporter permease [Cyclobacteriaceae bacterium HetDA_MAG_MS6]
MLNFFIAYHRQFRKYPSVYVLNILGLTIGVVIFVLLLSYTRHQLTYDQFHSASERIARVTTIVTSENNVTHFAVSSKSTAPAMSAYFPQISKACRTSQANISIRVDDSQFEDVSALYADSTFLDIFSFKKNHQHEAVSLLYGPNDVILTQSSANRYFNKANPIGKFIGVQNSDTYETFKVAAVIPDPPSNSTISFDVIMPFSEVAGSFGDGFGRIGSMNSYILLHEQSTFQEVKKAMPNFLEEKLGDLSGVISFDLQPLHDIYFTTDLNYDFGGRANVMTIYIFQALAILILLLAIINYINLYSATLVQRSQEISLRKVLGASGTTIFRQTLMDTGFTVLIVIATASVLILILVPYINEFASLELRDSFSSIWQISLFFLLLWMVISFLSGLYPALQSAWKSVTITAKTKVKGTTLTVQRTLLTAQLTITALSLSCVFIVHKQISYILNKDLGYQSQNVITVQVSNPAIASNLEILKSKIESISSVQNVSISGSSVIFETARFPFSMDEDSTRQFQTLNYNAIDNQYLKTHSISLLAGRNFRPGETNAFIINEKAMEAFGYQKHQDILGKTLTMGGEIKHPIVGVVANYHYRSLHQSIEPLVLTSRQDRRVNFMSILLRPGDSKQAISLIDEAWQETGIKVPFEPEFLTDVSREFYESENQLKVILDLVTVIFIIISLSGLFAMINLSIQQKVKEIAIRKVLGAGIQQILLVLTRPFLLLLLVGNLLAIPLVWYAASRWLDSFVQSIDIPWYVFAVTFLILFTLMLFTISQITIAAARANPTKSLKQD